MKPIDTFVTTVKVDDALTWVLHEESLNMALGSHAESCAPYKFAYGADTHTLVSVSLVGNEFFVITLELFGD